MAGSVNKSIILGNLGADPEIRSFANGGKVANLRIATSESWKDKQTGERQERTQWHSVVVHGDGLVDVVARFLKKGSKAYIEGQLETRKWQDQSGQDRYTTEIVVRPFRGSLTLLDGAPADGVRRASEPQPTNTAGDAGFYGAAGTTNSRADYDDEIPF